MKAVYLGTNHPAIDTEPDAILRESGLNYLQRLAGYIPAKMPVSTVQLHPITHHNQETIDGAMRRLCGREVWLCNPRTPYLMLAWLLVGSDNEFRVLEYAEADSYLYPVAHLLLQRAMGLTIDSAHIQDVVSNAWNPRDSDEDSVWPLWADEAVAWAAWTMENEGGVFVKAIETVILAVTRAAKIQATEAIQKQAREWSHIDDEEAWLVIQFLLTDIMDSQAK